MMLHLFPHILEEVDLIAGLESLRTVRHTKLISTWLDFYGCRRSRILSAPSRKARHGTISILLLNCQSICTAKNVRTVDVGSSREQTRVACVFELAGVAIYFSIAPGVQPKPFVTGLAWLLDTSHSLYGLFSHPLTVL